MLGNQSFVYDYSDQPTSLSGTVTGSYLYDGNLKRVKSVLTKNGTTKTIYNVYNASGKLVHVDAVTDNKSTDYIHGVGQTLAKVSSDGVTDTVTYLHPDHLLVQFCAEVENLNGYGNLSTVRIEI